MIFRKLSKMLFVSLLMLTVLSISKVHIQAANPYLPMWEYIPDGEPRLFEDPDHPGKYRVYIYGSHDTFRDKYCGTDLVVWSAAEDDLTNWRYEGVAFESIVNGVADTLFAPDVVEKLEADGTKTYYLYPNNQSGGRQTMIAKSDSPIGPFEVCNFVQGSTTRTEGILGFDPSVFIDDDGRVYGYWGFTQSNAAELDPSTMATIKAGTTRVTGMIPNGDQAGDFRFFEASSMRKIKDKYVFVYSRSTKEGEFGLSSSNCTLAYAYGDSPLGPWTYGGTLVDARVRDKGINGEVITTVQPWGNTHGSILEINGQWYVFHHRQINNSGYSRQAMVSPIQVEVTTGKGGKVVITEAEVTSEGFEINGLNPYTNYSAGIACWYTGGSYIKASYDKTFNSNPVINNANGSIVGYKYFNFDLLEKNIDTKLVINLTPKGKDGTIDVMMDSPWESKGGSLLGSINISADESKIETLKEVTLSKLKGVSGKHAIFFTFRSKSGGEICELNNFRFSTTDMNFTVGSEREEKQWISIEKVSKFIDAIGTVQYNSISKSLIDQARKAYDILTEEQKNSFINSKKLMEAEKEYYNFKKNLLEESSKNYKGAVINNGSFESDLESWTSNNAAAIEIVNSNVYTGSNCLFVSRRAATASGAKQEITGKVTVDVSYTVSAKIKYLEGVDSRQFQICIQNGSWGDPQIIASANINKGDWATIEGVFTLPSGTDLSSTSIIVQTSLVEEPTAINDLMDYYLDDVMLAKSAEYDGAKEVIQIIDAIGKVQSNDTSKTLIDNARKVYDLLTPEQKKLVTNRNKISEAEMTYKRLLKEDSFREKRDQLAADEVIKIIDAIGTVHYDDTSKGLIEAARKAYDTLTDAQKVFVANSNVLTESEIRYEELVSKSKQTKGIIFVALIGAAFLAFGGFLVYKKRHSK